MKYKSRIVTRKAVDGNGDPVLGKDGKRRKYAEKVVVYWSRAFYERQRHENRSLLEFVEELRKNPNGFRVTKANYRSLRKFLKKKVVNTETGEELDGTKLRAMIDDDKLDPWRRKRQPTPAFSHGKFHKQRNSMEGYSSWGCKRLHSAHGPSGPPFFHL